MAATADSERYHTILQSVGAPYTAECVPYTHFGCVGQSKVAFPSLHNGHKRSYTVQALPE